MLEQLVKLANEFGVDAVVKNEAIPTEKKEAVLEETSNSIFSSLQKIANQADLSQIAGLLQGKDIDKSRSGRTLERPSEHDSGRGAPFRDRSYRLSNRRPPSTHRLD